MDRTRSLNPGQSTTVATGIAVRQGQHTTSIRISFWYRGVECRETLYLPATKANLQYAERLRAEILNAIARRTFDYIIYFPDSKRAKIFGHVHANPLIGDLLQQFLELTKRTLQPSTVISYQKVCQAHLFPTFGRIPVKELTPAFIRQWVSGLHLTTKAIRNILTPLRAILNEAVNDDLILRNPLERVVLTKLLDKATCQSHYVPDPFNRQEIKAILSHAQGQIKHLVQFAFFSGLRPSELIGLAGQRELLLLPPALDALTAQKAYTFAEGKRVFHHPVHQKSWICDAYIRTPHWNQLLKRAGVRHRNLYQTRHTYASMLLSSGENMLWVSKQMGHRDTEMVMKTYGRWIPNTHAKAGYQPVHNWAKALG